MRIFGPNNKFDVYLDTFNENPSISVVKIGHQSLSLPKNNNL